MAEVKSYAVRHRQTFTSVLEDALQRLLSDEKAAPSPERVDVVVFAGRTGIEVDPADHAAIQRVLDEDDAAVLEASVNANS
jgi:hypothetical protein